MSEKVVRQRKSDKHDTAGKTKSNGKKKSVKIKENAEKDSSSVLPLYLSSAAVALFSILYYVFVYQEDAGYTVFVSAKDKVDKVVYTVKCSSDYDTEKFEGCKPKKCGRTVMDNLITESDARHLKGLAEKGMSYGGSSGGASILDLHSGALSSGTQFINIYKFLQSQNEALLTEEDLRIYSKVKDKIHAAIASEFGVKQNQLYLTSPTFFSRMNTTPPTTKHDEYWHPHIDKITYESFHYTSLLYLSTYGSDFTGGRFVFVDKDTNRTVEPRLGRISFFTSGSENLHFVERLVDGVRYAITISFTCDPSKAIQNPAIR